MDRRTFIGFIPVIALLGCASQGQEKTGQSGVRFSEAERKLITSYYQQQGHPRAPAQDKATGLARVGDKLMSGERPNKLPTNFFFNLTSMTEIYTRLTLGADVILVNRNTHDILDIIPQVAY